MVDHETLEFGDDFLMTTKLEIGLDPILVSQDSHLFETRDLGFQGGLIRQVGQRRPPPERQGSGQCRASRCHIARA